MARPWANGEITHGTFADSGLSGSATWNGELVGFTPRREAVHGDSAIQVDLAGLNGSVAFTGLRRVPACHLQRDRRRQLDQQFADCRVDTRTGDMLAHRACRIDAFALAHVIRHLPPPAGVTAHGHAVAANAAEGHPNENRCPTTPRRDPPTDHLGSGAESP